MTRAHLKLFRPIAVVLGLFASSGAEAMWVDVGPASSFDIGNLTISYTPSPAMEVKYYDDNISDQSPGNIGTQVETAFGLTAGSLTSVSSCGSAAGACTDASAATTTGTYQNTFTSNGAYDYLAIHFGRAELVFHWDTPLAGGTLFEIGVVKQGAGQPTFGALSNWRAYLGSTTPPSEVPVPAAIWLFGSALLGMIGISRRGAFAAKA